MNQKRVEEKNNLLQAPLTGKKRCQQKTKE